jgi:hypothetical protein
MNMEPPFPCSLLWGAMVGVALFAPVVIAEGRPDASSTGQSSSKAFFYISSPASRQEKH